MPDPVQTLYSAPAKNLIIIAAASCFSPVKMFDLVGPSALLSSKKAQLNMGTLF
jgi:hypothetical protein